MNKPRPNHTKRKKDHRYPSPVIPLYAGEESRTLVGYYNRRTGAIFTTHMNPSQADINNKANQAHLTRVRAAHRMGFNNTKEWEQTNNRKESRAWRRKFMKDIRLLARITKLREAYYQAKGVEVPET